MYTHNTTNTIHLISLYRALVPQQDRAANWTTKLALAHNNLSITLNDPMLPAQLASLKLALKAAHKILGELNEQVSKKYITVPPGGWKWNLPPYEKIPSMTLSDLFGAAERLKDAMKVMEAVMENVRNGWWVVQEERVVVEKRDDGEQEEEMEM